MIVNDTLIDNIAMKIGEDGIGYFTKIKKFEKREQKKKNNSINISVITKTTKTTTTGNNSNNSDEKKKKEMIGDEKKKENGNNYDADDDDNGKEKKKEEQKIFIPQLSPLDSNYINKTEAKNNSEGTEKKKPRVRMKRPNTLRWLKDKLKTNENYHKENPIMEAVIDELLLEEYDYRKTPPPPVIIKRENKENNKKTEELKIEKIEDLGIEQNIEKESSPTEQNFEEVEEFEDTKIISNILDSESLKSLNLKKGQNKITYLIHSRMMGYMKLVSFIYFWDYSDKVIICDIDGTITKSDVLGYASLMIGSQWGIKKEMVQILEKLVSKDYKILYLTTRSLLQSNTTRKQLTSTMKTPSGPVICSEDGIWNSFVREMIRKRSDVFKKNKLFILKVNLKLNMVSGFGNKSSDTRSYNYVDIKDELIFILNKKGSFTYENNKKWLNKDIKELVEKFDEVFT